MTKVLLNHEAIGKLCRELSLLLRAGVDLGDGLTLMQKESGDALLAQMASMADDGASLSEILRKSGAFPEDVCGMAEAGERSGRLEEALNLLSVYYENRARLDHRIRSAFLYPTILLLVMLVVIVVLLTQVLPIFNDVYANLGSGLTGVAGGLFLLGQTLNKAMPVLCGILILLIVSLAAFSGVPAFRMRLQRFWRKHFGNRGVSRKLSEAHFAMALALGVRSGLSDEEAVLLAAETMQGLPDAQARIEDCIAALRQEGSLPHALEKAELLPLSECRLLELGLRSGTGDAVVSQIAQRLSEQSENALEEKVSQIEPTLVVVSSVLVGLILLSVMLPLLDIMSAIG